MSKHQNGKIYKIVDVGYSKCSIGSTCEELSQIMARHRQSYNTCLKSNTNLERSHLLFDEFGTENCLIILVEKYPCNSREELLRNKGEHIKNTECANSRASMKKNNMKEIPRSLYIQLKTIIKAIQKKSVKKTKPVTRQTKTAS